MRKLAIAASAAVFSLASAAQQPLQCPNPDILNGLVFLGRSDMKMTITRGSPGFMGDFRAPAGFNLIGSGVRVVGLSTVAYKTSLAGDKTYTALLAALAAEGWALEATPGSGATFNVSGSPREGTVCRSGERRSVLVTETGGTTYASVLSFPAGRPRDCNAPDPGMNMPFNMARNAAPRFQFPAGTSLAQGSGGGGGSNQVYTTTSRIISAETPEGLVEHLASQIADQGWSADSGWSGAGNAGSTWRKTSDGQRTTGVLQISRVSKSTYDVEFTLLSPN